MRITPWLFAAAAFVSYFDATAQSTQTQPRFSKAQSLMCGGTNVSIKTSCSSSMDGAPPHCTQTLAFKGESGKDRFIDYKPKSAPHSDEPFVNQLSCSSANQKPYVIARSGNFGSCSTCEWIDAFTVHGEFVGSTPSVVRALTLPRKALSRRMEASLGDPREKDSVFIDRTYSEK
jgi:hypothetical protein